MGVYQWLLLHHLKFYCRLYQWLLVHPFKFYSGCVPVVTATPCQVLLWLCTSSYCHTQSSFTLAVYQWLLLHSFKTGELRRGKCAFQADWSLVFVYRVTMLTQSVSTPPPSLSPVCLCVCARVLARAHVCVSFLSVCFSLPLSVFPPVCLSLRLPLSSPPLSLSLSACMCVQKIMARLCIQDVIHNI